MIHVILLTEGNLLENMNIKIAKTWLLNLPEHDYLTFQSAWFHPPFSVVCVAYAVIFSFFVWIVAVEYKFWLYILCLDKLKQYLFWLKRINNI
jgi:hypothetical protein